MQTASVGLLILALGLNMMAASGSPHVRGTGRKLLFGEIEIAEDEAESCPDGYELSVAASTLIWPDLEGDDRNCSNALVYITEYCGEDDNPDCYKHIMSTCCAAVVVNSVEYYTGCDDPDANCICSKSKVDEGHCGGIPGCWQETDQETCEEHDDLWIPTSTYPESDGSVLSEEESGECGTTYYELWTCSDETTDGSSWIRNYYSDSTCETTCATSVSALDLGFGSAITCFSTEYPEGYPQSYHVYIGEDGSCYNEVYYSTTDCSGDFELVNLSTCTETTAD